MDKISSNKTAQSDDLAFEVWMQKVDSACESRFGVSIHDLPDYCFRDAFDDGETPAMCAKLAIQAARDY